MKEEQTMIVFIPFMMLVMERQKIDGKKLRESTKVPSVKK